MAAYSKLLLLFFVVFSLALVGIRGDAGVEVDEAEPEETLISELEAAVTSEFEEPLISELEASLTSELEEPETSELEGLRSKIAALESRNAEAIWQLEAKEETLLQFESVIREKAEIIASLEAEIESVQEKTAGDVAELEWKIYARTGELEKQLGKLKNDIQAQVHKRDAFEARAVEAEKQVEELNLMLESLQKTNDEQKKRIKMTQLALKEAEEQLMKVLVEASSKKKELTEIHGAWLPPWLSAHFGHCQATAAAHWNKHGKPSYDAFLQKVSDVLTQAQKKVEPHLETAKEKWIPTLKGHCVRVRTFAEPYTQLMTTKSLEVYKTSVVTFKSHIVRVRDIADPYFQEAKKFYKPYMDQVAMSMKPHMEKVHTVLKPFLKSAKTYHHQSEIEKYENTCESCSS